MDKWLTKIYCHDNGMKDLIIEYPTKTHKAYGPVLVICIVLVLFAALA